MAKFKKEWFNPLYFILQDALKKHPEISKVFCYGSKSSAKTFSIAQYIAKECYLRKTDAICFRKESTRIQITLKKTFSKAIRQTRLQNGYITQDFKFKTTKDNSINLSGLDSEDKVKGLEDFGYLLFDELDHFTFGEYEQADISFRGECAKVFFLTWNPISDKVWIKPYLDSFVWHDYEMQLPSPQSFVKISECGTMLYIKTVYTDNYWTVGSPCGTYGLHDKKLLAKYEALKKTNYQSWLVNCMGEWGKVLTGGEFWKYFKPESHVDESATWDEAQPIHLTWDDNVNPFLTCLVWQGVGEHVRQIDEICLEDPRNRVYDTCKEFMTRYPLDRVQGLFVYGDRTAMKEDTKMKKGENFYTKVMEYLAAYKPRLRMQTANPSVVMSAGFVNEIYAGRIEGASITISPRCTKSINDYQYALEDSDGTLKKVKKTHPVTKVSYEEHGHPSDAKRYFVVYYFRDRYQEYLKGGKRTKIFTGGPSKNKF